MIDIRSSNERCTEQATLIGNGTMLICQDGTSISEIYAGGYCVPSFLGISCDFGDSYAYSKRTREQGTATYVHRIYSSVTRRVLDGERISTTVEDIRMSDVMSPCADVFVRYCEAIRPFRVDFIIPPYVRKSLIRNYRIGPRVCDVVCLVMPAGVGFYKGFASTEERKLMIALDGDAKLSADGCSADIFTGSSRIILVSGDGEECIKNLADQLCDRTIYLGDSRLIAESEEHWRSILSSEGVLKKLRRSNTPDAIEEALITLLSLRTREGGLLAGRGEPIIRMSGVRAVTDAFIELGLLSCARENLEFFCKKVSEDGFYQAYGTRDNQKLSAFSNTALGCARLISAMLDFCEYTEDVGFFKKKLTVIRNAMYAQMDELVLKMMPFSGLESYITDEVLGLGCEAHGSLEATLELACAVLRLDKFCSDNSVKLPHDNGSARRRALEIMENIEKSFIHGNKVSINAPSRMRSVRRGRFAFGDCGICRASLFHIYYGELERGANGVYMCPRCFADYSDAELPKDGVVLLPDAAAILLSHDSMRDFIGQDRSRDILLNALEERRKDTVAHSVIADAFLLCVSRKLAIQGHEDFLISELERAIRLEFPRTMIGNKAIGRLDSETLASILRVI